MMNVSEHGDKKVVSMPERLDAGTSPDVEKELLAFVANSSSLICDFSGTSYISSAGLRVMLLMTKKMRSVKGEFAIASMQSTVSEVFKMAGFEGIMKIYATVQDALDA